MIEPVATGWDCHVHVFEAGAPVRPGHYRPAHRPLAQIEATAQAHGIGHLVLVQPSVYGTDNRVLLSALAAGQGRLVGVAAVDAAVDAGELDRLAAAGVRGVRMAHFAPGDPRAMGGFVPFQAFDALEDRLAARGLHLQLFTDSRLLPAIGERLLRARVPVVIDHMGRAPASLGADHAGVRALARLMQDGPVWTKLSGLANLSDDWPDFDDARALHDALLAAAPQRLVWGSDWPHTRPSGRRPHTSHLVDLFRAWTPAALQQRIGNQNAHALYRFPRAD